MTSGSQMSAAHPLERLRPYLYGLLGRVCGVHQQQAADADDLVQEVLFRAIRYFGPEPTSPERELRPWLRTVLIHCVIDRGRKARLRTAAAPADADVTSAEASPVDELIQAEEVARLDEALARLAEVEQQLVTAVAHGIPVATVAERLGMSEAAARKRQWRSIHKLSICLHDRM